MRYLWFSLLLVHLAACGGEPTSAEDEVRAWLSRGEAAAEAEDRSELMSMVSPGYTDQKGNDRDAINRTLLALFLRNDGVSLITRIESLEVFQDTAAEVTLTVGMAGGRDTLLGFSADAYRFVLQLERDDDDWQLISARWGELGEQL